MNFKTTTTFEKSAKRLSKKYPSFKKDFEALSNQITENPSMGVSLKGGFRKIRLSITSKGKGKSGGARVITYNVIIEKEVDTIIFVEVYDKSEIENITNEQIKQIFETLE